MIRARGCEMPGNRFSDIFLSRPNRTVNASVHELVTTFEVILELNHTYLTPTELIELCELTRVPFGNVQRFARFYPSELWRNALLQYNLHPQIETDDEIVERNDLLDRIEQYIVRAMNDRTGSGKRHIIISGPSGVGKTAVAVAAARRIEPIYGRRIPIVVLSPEITTLEQAYRAIGVIVGMKLIGTEPWALRMRNASALRNAVVILDNVSGGGSLTPESLLHDIFTTLPATMFIVTTQVVGTEKLLRESMEIQLEPLDYPQRQRLFWKIYRNAHGQDIDPQEVQRLLDESHGYPMNIVASANAAAQGSDADSQSLYGNMITGIPREAMTVVRVLSLVHQPLSMAFLLQLNQVFESRSEDDLRQIIQQLERRQIVTLRRHDGYVIHDALRSALRNGMPATEVVAILLDCAQAIHTDEMMREDVPTFFAGGLQTQEVLGVLELVTLLQQYRLTESVAKIAINWRQIWIRYGLCAEWCTIADSCARDIGEGHVLYAPLMYALGSFYGHRGIVDRTVLMLQTALRIAEQRGQSDIWAMAALECALHGLPSIGFAESERLLVFALSQFDRLGMRYWVARCYDTLSYVQLTAAQLQQSLKANDEALKLYGTSQVTYGRGDAHSNRGLVYMALGDYELARQELIKSEQIFQKLNAPSNTAAVHLRIAAICALWNRSQDARYYLTKAFRVLERSGGQNDLLYVIDICAALALTEGDAKFAIQLSMACSTLRQQQGIPRGDALEAIVLRQIEYAHILNNDAQVVPISANLMDLILKVRAYIYGNEPMHWQ
ncbi:MAG: hypothetical protein RLZZ297_1696, partial [Chloroflexota bacterium]